MPSLSELLAARKSDKPAPARAAVNVPLSARLGLTDVAVPELAVMGEFHKAPVTESQDLDRILALPRRPRPSENDLDALVAKWNGILGANPGPCDCEQRFAHLANPCINSLRTLQAWGCEEFSTEGGLVAKLAVGDGKTGLDILLAMCRSDVRTALLLLQPALIEQFVKDDYPQWAAHFKVPNLNVPRMLGQYPNVFVPGRPTLYVYSYSDLSLPKNTDLMIRLKPDLVIADESQNLANIRSSRTMRFVKHFQSHPECKFVPLSASMNTRGIGDSAHHFALALRERSPLPLDSNTVQTWAKALDPAPLNGIPTPIGKLRVLCNPGEDAVTGVGRRILETRGVIASEESSTDVPLLVTTRKPPPIPDELAKVMAATRATATRPDGEEAETSFQKAAWLKQLACGFYYFFRFIHGEPEETIYRWFARRKAWNKEVRSYLDTMPGEHLDSPLLLKRAAERFHNNYRGQLPTWNSYSYKDWVEVEDEVHPVQAIKWLDDHILNDAVAWAKEREAAGEGGVIWCEFIEIGKRVADALGVAYYNGGPLAKEGLRAEDGKRVIVCGIKAHHRGVNLQKFNRALVISNPADGDTWEQMIGRMHRYGQTKPVHYELYRHTPELANAMDNAMDRARWGSKIDKCQRKLLIAKRDF